MIKNIKTSDLKVGMYVILPESWFNHPFLKSSFPLKSREDIEKIIAGSFDEISIDTSMGLPVDALEYISHADYEITLPAKWEPEKLIPEEMREAIHDKSMNSQKKADIVYSSAIQIMSRLLDDPKTENIGVAKKGIAEIVDLIVTDTDTSFNLLRISSHDFYTYTHSVNVGVLCVLLSKALFGKYNAHNMHELGAGFFLHDIGKVRVAPEIINKRGRLSEDEVKKMRTHPYQSYKILSETGHLSEECKVITMQHHEREDGTGYPRRLKGDEIHIYGRICCIADVYDALTAERSYKTGLSPFEALKIMKEEMLHHFHKDIFEKFVLLFA